MSLLKTSAGPEKGFDLKKEVNQMDSVLIFYFSNGCVAVRQFPLTTTWSC